MNCIIKKEGNEEMGEIRKTIKKEKGLEKEEKNILQAERKKKETRKKQIKEKRRMKQEGKKEEKKRKKRKIEKKGKEGKQRSLKRNLTGKKGSVFFSGASQPNHSPDSSWKPDLLGATEKQTTKVGSRACLRHSPTRFLPTKLLSEVSSVWFQFRGQN